MPTSAAQPRRRCPRQGRRIFSQTAISTVRVASELDENLLFIRDCLWNFSLMHGKIWHS